MYTDLDGQRIQELAALSPEDLVATYVENPTEEHQAALQRSLGSALLRGDKETVKGLQKGIRGVDSQEADTFLRSFGDTLDLARQHWLRSRHLLTQSCGKPLEDYRRLEVLLEQKRNEVEERQQEVDTVLNEMDEVWDKLTEEEKDIIEGRG
jgi:hypothetical protein